MKLIAIQDNVQALSGPETIVLVDLKIRRRMVVTAKDKPTRIKLEKELTDLFPEYGVAEGVAVFAEEMENTFDCKWTYLK
ncbi:hypothetical protein [uncultured Roseibium sp.]|uniref:hypothetical protein n=1 Tax=uncultured Roseibium sp. TaxID=1936171 RepID=UPI0026376A17|nr:hypothetical protein [uncultured Roseibium sp.]